MPVFLQPQHRARKWGYENVYPGPASRSMLSPAGTFAYANAEQRLFVIREGGVCLPLETEEAQTMVRPGSPGRAIGFWKDDQLLLEAIDAGGTLAIFSWRPGQLIRLFGNPQVLPDGRRITVASYYHESHGGKPAIGASEDDLLFLASEEAPDKSRCTAIYRYDGELQRCAVLPASVSWLPDVRSFDRRGEYAVFIVNYSRPQLWLYGNGELRMLTEAWATGLQGMGHNLQIWQNGELETILGNADTLATFRNQPPSVVDSIRTVWASSSGHIFFDASTSGGEPTGIWQVLPANHRSYFLPVLPDLAEGGISYRSSMSIQNRGQEESRVQVTSIAPDGREAGVQQFRLSAGETRAVDTEQGGAFSGWARVAVEGGDTMVTERLTLDLHGHFSQLHLAPATPRREVYLPATPGWSSDTSTDLIGVAIVNPYGAEQEVIIERVGEGLEVREEAKLMLSAWGQRAFYVSDLLPASPEVKTVRIRATWPVAVTALNWSPLGICLQPVF